jgi:hypothetical protein
VDFIFEVNGFGDAVSAGGSTWWFQGMHIRPMGVRPTSRFPVLIEQ